MSLPGRPSGLPEIKGLLKSGYTADVITHHGVLEKTAQFVSKPVIREKLAANVWQAFKGEPAALKEKCVDYF